MTGAVFSADRRYRHVLYRDLPRARLFEPDRVGRVLWVLINPSKADETKPDPTLTRVLGFSAGFGFASLAICNLYQLVTPYPEELEAAADPLGPDADLTLQREAARAQRVVVGWGAFGARHPERVEAVVVALQSFATGLWCLGTTRSGQPRHPLYVRGDTPLEPWTPPAARR